MPPSRAEELLARALAQPRAQRFAWVEHACGGDTGLRDQLESQLLAHDDAARAAQDQPGPGGDRPGFEVVAEEKPGDWIGRYKLLQKIGEGGCGVVYMAEQEEAVRRRVALKVIKLGMDTKAVITRFEAERQALARMEHPNIARVLDAGATTAGRPYFVMELVRGMRITDYCDQNNLSTERRLQLFIKVCQAIQHAHQKGVIHRDIKPSNILVTLHDGQPVPKVIDFGIAKATQGRLTEQTLFTAFEQFIGTPAYVSPEQAEMSGLDIDTRSDIYSLGVLLYELLLGRTPFDTQDLVKAGIDEMRRRIREQEPARPSSRLRSLNDSDRTTIARRRGTDGPHLTLRLRGDLDWIVMRCLEKDRSRRYETANGLATDIQRHLDNEPVMARPPSTTYLLQKLVRRHRLAFSAGAIMTAALIGGSVFSTSMFFRERHAHERALAAERQARHEKVRAELAGANEARLRAEAQVREQRAQTEAAQRGKMAEVMTGTLGDLNRLVALSGDRMSLRDLIDQTDERKKQLADQPEVVANVDEMLGGTYFRLGEYERAEKLFQEALQLRRRVQGEDAPEVAQTLNFLGLVYSGQSRWPDAEQCHLNALEMQRQHFGPKHAAVAETMCNLAWVLAQQARLEESENLFRLAAAQQRDLYGAQHQTVATTLTRLGTVLMQEGRVADSEQILREAYDINVATFGRNSAEVAGALNMLAVTIALDVPRLQEAIQLYREAYEIREHLGEASAARSTAAGPTGAAREATGKAASHAGPAADPAPASLNAMLATPGSLAEVDAVLRDARRYAAINYGQESWEEAFFLAISAWIMLEEGKFEQAEAATRQCLTIREKLRPNDWSTHHARHMLGAALEGQHRVKEAETLLVEGYRGMRAQQAGIPQFHIPRIGEAVQRIIRFYERLSRMDEVAQWQTEFANLEPEAKRVLLQSRAK
jgi:eukaryotic-like serine/threonine-protein kinase